MPRWRVQLTGEHFDLEELPKVFNQPSGLVIEDGGSFFLQSAQFELCLSAEAVRESAVELLASLNALARLELSGFHPVGLGAIYEDSPSGRSITVVASDTIELRAKATVVILGSIQSVAQPRLFGAANDWLRLSTTDSTARRVLFLLSKKAPDWNDLYKTMEILEANGGLALLKHIGISKKDLGRFTQTANSIHAIGEHARHAKESIRAPKEPMTLNEAGVLIARWVRAWLASRSA